MKNVKNEILADHCITQTTKLIESPPWGSITELLYLSKSEIIKNSTLSEVFQMAFRGNYIIMNNHITIN